MSALTDIPLQNLLLDSNASRVSSAPIEISRLLHPSSGRRALDENELIEVADRLGALVEPWRVAVTAPSGRAYERILRTESCEAWLISWGPSTFLDLHDHGGSRGAFEVLSGLLVESSTDLTDRAPLATVHLQTGARRTFGPTAVHELWNPTDAAAVSIHAYSPPLSTMSFYAHDPLHYLERIRTETDLEWPDGA